MNTFNTYGLAPWFLCAYKKYERRYHLHIFYKAIKGSKFHNLIALKA